MTRILYANEEEGFKTWTAGRRGLNSSGGVLVEVPRVVRGRSSSIRRHDNTEVRGILPLGQKAVEIHFSESIMAK
jgi:hypothetical protein